MRPRAYVINLSSASDRRRLVAQCLGRLHIDFEIVEAVDGRAFDVEAQPIYDGSRRRALFGHDMVGGEVGCLLSHRQVLRRIVERRTGPALVFEDDIVLNPGFTAAVDGLMARQDQWELVRFLGGKKILRQPQRRLLDLGGGLFLSRLATQPGGAAAYLVSERGAAKLLKHLDRTPFPIDALMGRPWLTGVDNLIAGPGLAHQNGALESDIGEARFVSHKRIAARAGFGRKLTIGWRRLSDNVASRVVFWGGGAGRLSERGGEAWRRRSGRAIPVHAALVGLDRGAAAMNQAIQVGQALAGRHP